MVATPKHTYKAVCRAHRQTAFFWSVAILAVASVSITESIAQTRYGRDSIPNSIFLQEEIQESIESSDSDSDEELSDDDADDDEALDEESEEDLPFTLTLSADVYSQRMAKGTSISEGNPTFSPSADLSHTSGFTTGLGLDQIFGSVNRFSSANVYLEYEYELSDIFSIGTTYTRSFYSDEDSAIFAYARNQISIYSDLYTDGWLAGVGIDYFFGDNNLYYLNLSVSYSFPFGDWRISPIAGTSISYNDITKGKATSSKSNGKNNKTKQELALSNAFTGLSCSYELGAGFTATASARIVYSKEETSNKKTTQFSASCGIGYDLDF